MNYSTHRLSLDLHDTSSCHMIYCKKGDTARQIAIDLNESGVPYILSQDCSAVFVATKPDKNGLYHPCKIENNVIYYQFTEQTAPVVGQVDCEIRIYGSNKELITSAGFVLIVEDVEYTDGEIMDSETDFGGLGSLITLSGAEATIDDSVGTPTVEVMLLGNDAYNRKLAFKFSGLRGKPGKDYILTEDDQKKICDTIIRRLVEQDGILPAPQIENVTLFAHAWEGGESPYSQVVSIEGVTKNSQVNLTPSVDQLTVFHNKDLTFVTENVGGVVTVYAIGEKPVNDYTIQATITEVRI